MALVRQFVDSHIYATIKNEISTKQLQLQLYKVTVSITPANESLVSFCKFETAIRAAKNNNSLITIYIFIKTTLLIPSFA
jgi:hypothetical protein